ncbi:hypothetical protein [Paraburkholderia flava]|uniref:hypothetical protein n=1 Tax=Paraburkholderia flava TaxID=2547393 RepID=UPI00105D16B3|nr:hypothetical protein [Paraburkholderia flava]
MKHAGSASLDQLDNTLGLLRELPGLSEKSRGVFYRRGKAFLHFHEDPTGLYADLRAGDVFERYPVNTAAERAKFVALVRVALDQR